MITFIRFSGISKKCLFSQTLDQVYRRIHRWLPWCHLILNLWQTLLDWPAINRFLNMIHIWTRLVGLPHLVLIFPVHITIHPLYQLVKANNFEKLINLKLWFKATFLSRVTKSWVKNYTQTFVQIFISKDFVGKRY